MFQFFLDERQARAGEKASEAQQFFDDIITEFRHNQGFRVTSGLRERGLTPFLSDVSLKAGASAAPLLLFSPVPSAEELQQIPRPGMLGAGGRPSMAGAPETSAFASNNAFPRLNKELFTASHPPAAAGPVGDGKPAASVPAKPSNPPAARPGGEPGSSAVLPTPAGVARVVGASSDNSAAAAAGSRRESLGALPGVSFEGAATAGPAGNAASAIRIAGSIVDDILSEAWQAGLERRLERAASEMAAMRLRLASAEATAVSAQITAAAVALAAPAGSGGSAQGMAPTAGTAAIAAPPAAEDTAAELKRLRLLTQLLFASEAGLRKRLADLA